MSDAVEQITVTVIDPGARPAARCTYHPSERRFGRFVRRCRQIATHYAVFPDAEYVDVCPLHARAIAKIYGAGSFIFRIEAE